VELLAILKKKNIKNRQYVSERVNRMVEAGVVERERVGKRMYYSKINREPMVADTSEGK
jgi:DNA-binding transcriptional regulator PaaX